MRTVISILQADKAIRALEKGSELFELWRFQRIRSALPPPCQLIPTRVSIIIGLAEFFGLTRDLKEVASVSVIPQIIERYWHTEPREIVSQSLLVLDGTLASHLLKLPEHLEGFVLMF